MRYSTNEKDKSQIVECGKYLQIKQVSVSKLPEPVKDRVKRKLSTSYYIEETDQHAEYLERIKLIKSKCEGEEKERIHTEAIEKALRQKKR